MSNIPDIHSPDWATLEQEREAATGGDCEHCGRPQAYLLTDEQGNWSVLGTDWQDALNKTPMQAQFTNACGLDLYTTEVTSDEISAYASNTGFDIVDGVVFPLGLRAGQSHNRLVVIDRKQEKLAFLCTACIAQNFKTFFHTN